MCEKNRPCEKENRPLEKKKKSDPPESECESCQTVNVEDTVRIYSIEPKEDQWEKFFKVEEYSTSNGKGFANLQKRLYSKERGFVVEEDSDGRDSQAVHVHSDDPLPAKTCQLITVSHLSPQVAKLLGAKFKISADFFNRHLPGTEAISGRLVSRLPSSVQIDFDELYESTLEFEDLWPGAGVTEQENLAAAGHHQIEENIRKHFLFPVGWDYFPICQQDWLSSTNNVKLKSGYEVLLRDGLDEMKNVFQFNLAHRISIFSAPLGHPRTGTSIFVPSCKLIITPSSDHHILSRPTGPR